VITLSGFGKVIDVIFSQALIVFVLGYQFCDIYGYIFNRPQ